MKVFLLESQNCDLYIIDKSVRDINIEFYKKYFEHINLVNEEDTEVFESLNDEEVCIVGDLQSIFLDEEYFESLIKHEENKIEINKEILIIKAKHLKSNNNHLQNFKNNISNKVIKINDFVELSKATDFFRDKINLKHLKNGVMLINQQTITIGHDVVIGKGSVIYPNSYIIGKTVLGENCEIKTSYIESSTFSNNNRIGPYANIRANTTADENCHFGAFVELKNSSFGKKVSASHLTYVGDSEVGSNVNFGCGTVTANYDGKNKFTSKINDNAFIGCNTNLISPVEVGENAMIAAGSTITENVPPNSLAIARERQTVKENWKKNNF